jgi:phospholipid:diacylglycerol acyltransferase
LLTSEQIIENLAAIGYDPNTMYSAAYDRRLSYINLEERDRYFTKLKVGEMLCIC